MQTIECDVLVIGGGLAGCWAALRAREMGARVVLMERGRVSRSGKSSFAGAGILYPQPQDNLDQWHNELVQRGEFINDQEWLRILLQELEPRISDMDKRGVPFERDSQGKITRFTPLSESVKVHTAAVNSVKMMETMRNQLALRGINIAERTLALELLTGDGQLPTQRSVCGALGLRTETGELLIFKAKAVVIATGGTGYIDLTGDGIALAFRAGAEIQNMEYSRVHRLGSVARKYVYAPLIPLQRVGWILRNARGERFMERYHPDLKENAGRQRLAPAIVTEILEGRGPVYMDLTHLNPENLAILRNGVFATQLRNIEKAEGYDPEKQLIEYHVSTGEISTESGGIRNNIYCETNIPGLYAAGEAGGYPTHGSSDFIVGINIGMCCVSGYRAGEYSALYALDVPDSQIIGSQVLEMTEQANKYLKIEKGLKPDQFFSQLKCFLSPADMSIFRTKKGMEKVLSRMGEWENSASNLLATDSHELVKAHKVRNYLDIVRLFCMSALIREESRGVHIRLDYPYHDDINWLKWVILKGKHGEINHSLVPIPMYRYAIKPEKYERLPVSYPLPKISN